MIKKKDLSKEDSEVWQSYIKNPTDVYDKDLGNKSTNRKERFKFKTCKNIVLVGSGFYPYSLFDVYKQYEHINLIGWILFIISAIGFIIASIGSFWSMVGSVFFLLACLVFLIPFFRKD